MKIQKDVMPVMQATGFYDQVGADHFLEEETALTYLLRRVVDPAICVYECPVRAFTECQNLPKHPRSGSLFEEPLTEFGSISEIPSQALWQQLNSGSDQPLIIDVREPREYKRGHLPYARLSPWPDLLTNINGLPYDTQIVLVCQGGRRSRHAAHLLRREGYTNVAIVRSGMRAWLHNGYPNQIDLPADYQGVLPLAASGPSKNEPS